MKLAAAAFAALCLAIVPAEARTWRIEPGANAQAALQTALIEARPGDTIRLREGRFTLDAGLSLDVDRVTIEGEGMGETILDFTNQRQGAEGLLVTSNEVTLREFAVENARGDAVKARDCDRITFFRIRAEWTRGPHADNGAYGLYPVSCTNVLIDESVAIGASDAGIYVGQSRNIIVRRSRAERNVAGIEIENSFNADVFENVATQNTGGILVFDLPGLPQMGGHSVRVFRNEIVGNNTPNFAPAGNIVATVPAGTGLLIMANSNIHVFDNVIGENGTTNIAIAAYRETIQDANYNPLPRDVVIRNNQFGRVGFAPAGDFAGLVQMGVQLPDILWDGAETYTAAGRPRTEPVRIGIRNNRAERREVTFLSLGIPVAGSLLTEAQPNANPPVASFAEEPERVELPQD
ncbi:MAG: parallel beta-helix domain-containing protein [Hyphomonadaceae bacterium]